MADVAVENFVRRRVNPFDARRGAVRVDDADPTPSSVVLEATRRTVRELDFRQGVKRAAGIAITVGNGTPGRPGRLRQIRAVAFERRFVAVRIDDRDEAFRAVTQRQRVSPTVGDSRQKSGAVVS